jgi:toxin ParE1/3/4
MAELKLVQLAQQDLKDIWRGLAEYRLEIADQKIKRITKKLELLRQFPLAGRQRDDLLPNIRSIPVDQFLVFYRILQEGDRTIVEIDRIIDGKRDLQSLFSDPE